MIVGFLVYRTVMVNKLVLLLFSHDAVIITQYSLTFPSLYLFTFHLEIMYARLRHVPNLATTTRYVGASPVHTYVKCYAFLSW